MHTEKKQDQDGTPIPDFRVQTHPCFLKAKSEKLSKMLRFTNKATNQFLRNLF